MPSHILRSRPPRGDGSRLAATADPDILRSHLEDAAHFPGGHAPCLYTPETEGEVSEALRRSASVLPIGAQSSLTGGATPRGESLLSTRRLTGIERVGADRVRVGAGATMAELDAALREGGCYYPPAATFFGVFVGGAIATTAA